MVRVPQLAVGRFEVGVSWERAHHFTLYPIMAYDPRQMIFVTLISFRYK